MVLERARQAFAESDPPAPEMPVSPDGKNVILVPRWIGKLIELALSAQEKIDVRAEDLKQFGMDIEESNKGFDAAVDLVRGINCHKTILFLTGKITRKQLLEVEYEDEPDQFGKYRQRPDTAGHPEILELQVNNPDKVLVSKEDVMQYLQEHEAEGPFSVHIIRKREDGDAHYPGDDETWRPAHSFMYLKTDEEGNHWCFHKRGPFLRMRFELTTLEKVLGPYGQESARFLVLPANLPEKK